MNNPMPLGDLPEHLKSAREESEEYPDMGVVDMGRIVIRKKSRFPLIPILTFLIILLGGVGIMTYTTTMPTEVTVVVDVVDPQAIPAMIENSGGEIISVEHKQDFIYEVKMSTRKNKNSLLEWFRNNINIRSAEVRD